MSRPTHFLSLPIGRHPSLQSLVSSFTTALLETTPALPGLDRTIVIPPRRLHLTLGVMALSNSRLAEALSLLSSLKPCIMEMLCGAPLRVPLQNMGIMPPERGDPDKAHVLWLGPSPADEDARRLRRVCEMLNRSFIDAGFITDRRPLMASLRCVSLPTVTNERLDQLHCTILNTIYRRPAGRRRQPFSYRALLASSAARAVSSEGDWRGSVGADFGIWDVDEIQICRMGSSGPEGEYLSCGGLVLGG